MPVGGVARLHDHRHIAAGRTRVRVPHTVTAPRRRYPAGRVAFTLPHRAERRVHQPGQNAVRRDRAADTRADVRRIYDTRAQHQSTVSSGEFAHQCVPIGWL